MIEISTHKLLALLAKWEQDAKDIEWATGLVGGETKGRGDILCDLIRQHISELKEAMES